MNTRIMRLMRLHRLLAEAGDGGSDAGGTGTGTGAAAAPAPAAPAAAAPAPAPAADTPTLLGADDEPAADTADGAAKPEGEGEKKPDDGEKKNPEGAPEEYADFTMPEGVKLDGELATDLKGIAKKHNLTQEAAQEFAALGAKQMQKLAGTNADLVRQARAEWAAAAAADAEYGGDEFKANLAYARKARDTFGTPAFKDLMNGSGLGDHPEVLRFMVRAGKAISGDTFVAGGAAKAPKSDAEVFYGSSQVSQPAR